MLLAGCGNVSGKPDETKPALAAASQAARRAAMAPVCPTPTPDAKGERIATYLEAAPPDPGLDVLATEWERLDDGARTCRTGRPSPPS